MDPNNNNPAQPSSDTSQTDPQSVTTPTPTWTPEPIDQTPSATGVPTPPNPAPGKLDPVPASPEPSPVQQPSPTPTFVPPTEASQPASPPWGQTSSFPQPTPPYNPLPVSTPDLGMPSAMGTSSSVDAAPTDLSQLATNPPSLPTDLALTIPSVDGTQGDGNVGSVPTSTGGNNTPQVVTSDGKHHISKWIFIIGGVVLLLAISGSVYFLLFANNSGSSPEVEQPAPNPKTSPTLPPVITQQEPVASPSANFGDLQGASPSAQSSPSAKSAIELLKQRQNQR